MSKYNPLWEYIKTRAPAELSFDEMREICGITPEEMDIEPDEYKYDVGLQTADGDFYKVISESSFTVLSSTTKKRVSGGE